MITGPRPWLILALAVPGLVLLPFAIVASILGTRYRRRVERGTLPQNRLAQVGLVLGAAGILLGMIQLCAIIFLLPMLMSGVKPKADQAHAISKLRKLYQIQEDYKKLTGSYAASLKTLEQRGFINPDFTNIQNYRLEMKAPETGKAFEVRAIPLKPGKPYYYIDQSDILRTSEGPEIGQNSPPVAKAKETTR